MTETYRECKDCWYWTVIAVFIDLVIGIWFILPAIISADFFSDISKDGRR
jgi:hypothetical protein